MFKSKLRPTKSRQPKPDPEDPATGGSFQTDEHLPTPTVSIRDTSSNRKLDSFPCSSCRETFSDPLKLFAHKRDAHPLQRIILPLDVVKKYFDYPNRRFCPICKKGLRSKGYRSIFLKHLMTHTTSLKYKCKVCQKEFTRKDHMKMHEKRHVVPLQDVLRNNKSSMNLYSVLTLG